MMSLVDQVDQVIFYDNSVDKDYSDNAKFLPLDSFSEPIYFLSCDDDLIYPPDYVQKIIHYIDNYQAIISFHGRILKEPCTKYYGSQHEVFDYRAELLTSKYVDVVGTGVCGFRTDYFNPADIYKSEYKRMSDLVFSLEAKKQGKTLICAEHPKNWIITQPTECGIMQSEMMGSQENQIKLAQQILRL